VEQLARRFAGFGLEHLYPQRRDEFAQLLWCAGERRERAEVHGQDLSDSWKLARLGSLKGTHRVDVADRQETDRRPIQVGDEPHIAEETG